MRLMPLMKLPAADGEVGQPHNNSRAAAEPDVRG
jgi:hypothetical protein